jgi:hypothetical protein
MLTLPYPVYCPKWGEMAALDWDIGPVTSDLDLVMRSDFKIAALPVMCNLRHDFAYKPEIEYLDLSVFDLVILTDIEYRPIAWIQEWIEKNGRGFKKLSEKQIKVSDRLSKTALNINNLCGYDNSQYTEIEAPINENVIAKVLHMDVDDVINKVEVPDKFINILFDNTF